MWYDYHDSYCKSLCIKNLIICTTDKERYKKKKEDVFSRKRKEICQVGYQQICLSIILVTM